MRIPRLNVLAVCFVLLLLTGCAVVPLFDSSPEDRNPAPVQPKPMSTPTIPAPSKPAPVSPPESVKPTPVPSPQQAPAPVPKAAPTPPPAPAPVPAPVPTPAPSPTPPPPSDAHSDLQSSLATDPKAYRKDAARHLYHHYAQRVHKGRLPPMLKSVGVVDVQVGPKGQVLDIVWTRAPRQAEVRQEIERMIITAGPFPAPVKLRKVTYTETWLWLNTGHFQLDTLTEGQN